MLAVYYTGRATVSDAWRILHFRLQPTARAWLGIPESPPSTARACTAASRRLYRGLDRITTVLDPARCDRRRRLGQAEADIHSAVWDGATGRQAANRLQRLANDLVLVPVRLAQHRGYLRHWSGDVGVDATSIPVLARPDSDRSGTASVEITAGWHYRGGSDEGIFGYSATLLVAAHSRTSEQAAKGRRTPSYPQLCLGLTLDTPTVRTGENAVALLGQLADLRTPAGTCAADRAYTGCSPEKFQVPSRRLGFRLALDYKAADRGIQGSWQGAVLIDDSLACPQIPNVLAQATHGMDDKTFRQRLDELKPVVAERLPYFLKLKQNADARGTVRLQCPAAGPSPSVNCPRRERLRPAGPSTSGPPQTVVRLADRRSRASHPAARPTVQLPDGEWIDPPRKDELPAVCGASAISVPADAAGDLNQVAQTLLVAIMVTVGNLDILEAWLYERTGSRLSDTEFESVPARQALTHSMPWRRWALAGIRRATSDRSATQPDIAIISSGQPGPLRMPPEQPEACRRGCDPVHAAIHHPEQASNDPVMTKIPSDLAIGRDLLNVPESYSRTVVCGPVGI
ncbi:hypothetical protein ACIGBH_35080 [Streptomyces sp. NPDC085929]|uniref:hypothetical protein n=1 Tax=Streptomyces sp. NPDC085929 TaxID=3365739 RepID=UPI0037D33D24